MRLDKNLHWKPVGDEELYEIINETLKPCHEWSEEVELSNPMEKIYFLFCSQWSIGHSNLMPLVQYQNQTLENLFL